MITRFLRRFWFLSPTEQEYAAQMRADYPQFKVILFRRKDAR